MEHLQHCLCARDSRIGFIYQFVFPDGRKYVGQTKNKDVRKRWSVPRTGSSLSSDFTTSIF